MNDTEQVVSDSFDQAIREGRQHPDATPWIARYGGRDSLAWRVEALWRGRFPDRRNRPTHRNVEAALRRLVAAGILERRDGEFDTYYRKALS